PPRRYRAAHPARRGGGEAEDEDREGPEPDHRDEQRRIAIAQIFGDRILPGEDADCQEGEEVAAGLGGRRPVNTDSISPDSTARMPAAAPFARNCSCKTGRENFLSVFAVDSPPLSDATSKHERTMLTANLTRRTLLQAGAALLASTALPTLALAQDA